jgi:cysteine desulfurase
MGPYLHTAFGNPSAVHAFGREVKAALEQARESVARLLGTADKDEVVFVASGTEADNLALTGVAFAYQDRGRHLITSAVEHPAVLETCTFLERQGFQVTYLPVDHQGMPDPADLLRAIRPDTILVSLMHANNETGVLFPMAEIGAITKARGVFLHTDAVQSFGKIPLTVKDLGVDLLSLSAHKIYGPKGVGTLYIRRGVRLHPLIHGGHQERGRRAGTENVPGIVGLAAAARLIFEEMPEESERLRGLRDRLEAALRSRIEGVTVSGHPTLRLPHTTNLAFEGVEAQSLVAALDLEGVAVSAGSACAVGSLRPSHVLQGMGLPRERVEGSIRFSLGRLTAEEDIDTIVDLLPAMIARLRQAAPVGR